MKIKEAALQVQREILTKYPRTQRRLITRAVESRSKVDSYPKRTTPHLAQQAAGGTGLRPREGQSEEEHGGIEGERPVFYDARQLRHRAKNESSLV